MTASNSGTYCSDVHVVLVAEHSEASSPGVGAHNRKGRTTERGVVLSL